jgi:hypothetical protein
MYEARKVAGLCVACGLVVEAEVATNTCRECTGKRNQTSLKSQADRLKADPAYRRARNKNAREKRRLRRLAGLCLFCNNKASGVRCDTHRAIEAAAYQEKKNRPGRAKNKRGRALAVLLDFILASAPSHLEDPLTVKELLARVVETYGSVSDTVIGAERRMHRSLAALVAEGRLVRVRQRGTVAGYVRPRITREGRGVATSDTSQPATAQHSST